MASARKIRETWVRFQRFAKRSDDASRSGGTVIDGQVRSTATVSRCSGVTLAVRDIDRRFILTLMVEALDTNAELSKEFREMLHRFRSFHRRLIRRGQEQGAFRRDLDVAVAAATFVSGILGAEIQFYQEPDSFDVATTLDCHVDQFLSWVAEPRAARRRVAGGKQNV